jgi:hypothetical protein
MANHANKTTNLVPVYGIIISVIAIALSLIFYMTNYYDTLWTGFMIGGVIFIGVLLSVFNYNTNHHERTNAAAMFGMGLRDHYFYFLHHFPPGSHLRFPFHAHCRK